MFFSFYSFCPFPVQFAEGLIEKKPDSAFAGSGFIDPFMHPPADNEP
jgi:hypothetical protein